MTTTILDIIQRYQLSANNVFRTFKEKYKVKDILEGWHTRVYEQAGKLIDETKRKTTGNIGFTSDGVTFFY